MKQKVLTSLLVFVSVCSRSPAEQMVAEASYHLKNGSTARASSIMQTAREQFPNDPSVRRVSARVLVVEADAELKAGHPDLAAKLLLEADQFDPTNEAIPNLMWTALSAQRKFQEALVYAEKDVQIHPESQLAHMNLGMTLIDSGRPTEALAILKKALTLKASDEALIRAEYITASAASMAENEKDAIEHLTRFSDLAEKKPDAWQKVTASSPVWARRLSEARKFLAEYSKP